METFECIRTRRSVRKFTDEEVSRDTIEKIIDVARMAPSWKNTQTARYIVVQDKQVIDRIADEAVLNFEYNMKTLHRSNILVVLTSIANRSGYEKDGSFSTPKGQGWEMFDAGIAAQTFCLAAHELGVGSCIIGVFDDSKIADMINLPEGQNVSALIPIGIPASAPAPVPRKEVNELLTYYK